MLPLFKLHWVEVAHYADIELNPNTEMYFKLDDANMFRTYTVRDDQWNLVGYALFFLKTNMHYQQSLQAFQDVIFLDPKNRGTTGAKFIKYCDEQLRDEGVQVVAHHVKAAHNFGKMLERFGYELQDLIYTRRLDK